ncbi:endoplasmic reticulum aminopeptidase 1 [Amia ocellicauda]|uniref:endoplasmic reticulum aminopeptidase 1 n=1 Tax=Amia ocellicauda TaxID=2972642 RepID=UPI0034647F66
MFDVVSYCKGASILRMLHNYLTEDVFTQGIRDYLKQHSYKNAQQDDLWEALEKSALKEERKVEVKAIMDTWTTQKGYPLVSVKVDGRKLKLHQDIFSLYPENGKSFLWQIPFTFYTSNSPSVITHLMRKREETIDLHHDVAWIKANVNSTGFYRVSYDPHTLHVIIRQLQESHTVFSKADRASLIDDTFHLASQGSVQFSDAFALCLFVKEEREYLPIRMFMAHIGKMMSKFSFSRQRCALGLLKDHLWTLLGGLIQAQHWEEGGSLSQQKLRTLLLATGIGLHSPSSRQRAQELFHHWMAADGKIQLPRMLRGLIFRMGIRRGGHREWMFLLQQYLRTVSSSDKVLLLSALSRTRNPNKRKWQVL